MSKSSTSIRMLKGVQANGGVCWIEVHRAEERPPLVVVTELPENPVASITNMAEYLAAEVKERYLTPNQVLGHQPPLLWIEHYERTEADRRIGLTESWEQITFAHYRREQTRKFARVPGSRYRIGLPRQRELLSPETFAELKRLKRRYEGERFGRRAGKTQTMKRPGPDTTTSQERYDERTRSQPGRAPQWRAVDPQTGRLYRIVRSASAPAGPAAERPEPSRSFSLPPPALRNARLDNLAIVPASLLPEKAEWQALANTLPEGSTLIILPSKPSAARAALEEVSRSLSAHGSRVTTVEQGARPLEWHRREAGLDPTNRNLSEGPSA